MLLMIATAKFCCQSKQQAVWNPQSVFEESLRARVAKARMAPQFLEVTVDDGGVTEAATLVVAPGPMSSAWLAGNLVASPMACRS